jgi:hypothetical protein
LNGVIATSVDTIEPSWQPSAIEDLEARSPAVAPRKEPPVVVERAAEVQPEVPRVSIVIPVGQEPSRQSPQSPPAAPEPRVRARPAAKESEGIRDPDGFFRYKNRLEELRVFTMETQRCLKRSEIAVWLAIHNCQKRRVARISQDRISELAGTSKKHVGKAIRELAKKGLLEVLFKGKFVRNGDEGSGLASIYRVFPRPEPRLLADRQVEGDAPPASAGNAEEEPTVDPD